MSDLTNTNNPEQDTPIPDGFVPAPVTPETPAPEGGTPAAPVPPTTPEAPAPDAPAQPPAPAPLPPLPEKTGDAALDLALSYMLGKGIALDDPAVEAARAGDFSAIETKLKASGATDYDAYLEAAKGAYERFDAKHKEQEKVVLAAAEAACKEVGGWDKVREWAGKTASPEQARDINAALANGGIQAKATLAWLARAYAAANPVSGTPAVKPNAAPAGPSAGDGLSAREYAREVDKLYAQSGFRDITGTPEYKALQARRLAGKAAGR